MSTLARQSAVTRAALASTTPRRTEPESRYNIAPLARSVDQIELGLAEIAEYLSPTERAAAQRVLDKITARYDALIAR